MDVQLIRSFLAVVDSGSFAAASDRLFVTQSAVSLRIQRLEEQMGRALFTRSKDGVELTVAGSEFRGFAITILRNWEMARQRLQGIDEPRAALTIAAEYALWPRLGFEWLDLLRSRLPDVVLRGEMGPTDTLAQLLLASSVQATLSFAPMAQPGVTAELLGEESFVLVSTRPGQALEDLRDNYVLVDWGHDFMRFHAEALPQLHNGRLALALGLMAGSYIAERDFAAYLPLSYLEVQLAEGDLHLVETAPRTRQKIWVNWREDLDSEMQIVARETLEIAANQLNYKIWQEESENTLA